MLVGNLFGLMGLTPSFTGWGRNQSGELGLGMTIAQANPAQISSSSQWSKITVGGGFRGSVNGGSSFAIGPNGFLYAWGANSYGQLGLGDSVSRSIPTKVGTNTWSSISCRGCHTLGITTAGFLYAWGYNNTGQLGTNDTVSRNSPVKIGSNTWASAIGGTADGRGGSSFGITTSGKLYSWGDNSSGQLGSLSVINRSSPVQVGALTTWSKVNFGVSDIVPISGQLVASVLAVSTGGKLYGWGNNRFGQVGDNSVANRSSPVQIGALTTWASISGSGPASGAINTSGDLFTWGYNNYGQLGLSDLISRSSPVKVGAKTWSTLSMGHQSAFSGKDCVTGMGLTTTGKLYAWGQNSYGLGVGTTGAGSYTSSPVQVGNLTTWTQISTNGGSFLGVHT